MRYLRKPPESEAAACIRGFIGEQSAGRASGIPWEELRLDYGSFTRTSQLRDLLIEEQKGLCAYTGAGLDHRLVKRAPSRDDYSYKPHIEHLTSQRQCREELEAQGGVVGRDLGQDLSYSNLVAALEVVGTASEHFGAVSRSDRPLPIIPTNPACSTAFLYAETGEILGTCADANATIRNLRLDHQTLNGWRSGAIQGLLPLGARTPRATLEALIEVLEDEARPSLPEFSFVVAQIARAFLSIKDRSQDL
jgi:hypothetical protein